MIGLRPCVITLAVVLLAYFTVTPAIVSAYTYNDVTNYLNANPAPSDCMNWVESYVDPTSGNGYKVWRRCGNLKKYRVSKTGSEELSAPSVIRIIHLLIVALGAVIRRHCLFSFSTGIILTAIFATEPFRTPIQYLRTAAKQIGSSEV